MKFDVKFLATRDVRFLSVMIMGPAWRRKIHYSTYIIKNPEIEEFGDRYTGYETLYNIL